MGLSKEQSLANDISIRYFVPGHQILRTVQFPEGISKPATEKIRSFLLLMPNTPLSHFHKQQSQILD